MSAFHESAAEQVDGSAAYIDDRPPVRGELHVEVYFSPYAYADIVSLDFSEALRVEGVRGIFTARDLHHNIWGTIFQDQPFLAEKQVKYVGEAVAVIAAETKDAALEARRRIRAEYRELTPLLDLDEAITARAFIGPERQIRRGDPESELEKAPYRLQGTLSMAAGTVSIKSAATCIPRPMFMVRFSPRRAPSQPPTRLVTTPKIS